MKPESDVQVLFDLVDRLGVDTLIHRLVDLAWERRDAAETLSDESYWHGVGSVFTATHTKLQVVRKLPEIRDVAKVLSALQGIIPPGDDIIVELAIKEDGSWRLHHSEEGDFISRERTRYGSTGNDFSATDDCEEVAGLLIDQIIDCIQGSD